MKKREREEREYALIAGAKADDRGLVNRMLGFGANIDSTVAGGAALHVAIALKNAGLAEWLMTEHGASPNVRDRRNGQTPLHYAFRQGNEDLALLLIAKGASLLVKDNDGKLPLAYAPKGDVLQFFNNMAMLAARREKEKSLAKPLPSPKPV